MVRRLIRLTILLAVALGAWNMLGDGSTAVAWDNGQGGPALFQNYYAPPGTEGISASLYPAPVPTPPYVGHTYITYPPLAPHEFLYKHQRTYYRDHPDGGRTRARISWR